MIINLLKYILFGVCLIVVLKSNESNEPRVNADLVKRFTGQKISYDMRYNKRQLKLAIGLTILWVASVVVPEGLYVVAVENGRANAFNMMLGFLWERFVLLIAALAWLIYFDSLFYLKRLRKYGYVVPEDRKKYVYLEHLPQTEKDDCFKETIEKETISKESCALAIVSWVGALGMVIGMILFWQEHMKVPDIAMVCTVLIAVIIILWIYAGVFYWKQRLRSKYRDDVELDASRKKRVHFVFGFGFLLGMLFASSVAVLYMDFGADYIEYAREDVIETTVETER